MKIEWKNERLKNNFKVRRENKWRKFEHRKDYGHFKPNEGRVGRDSNQTSVSHTIMDEGNVIASPNQFNTESKKKLKER